MNLNKVISTHLKSQISEEPRKALVSFLGEVDHGKSTFFDSLTNQNVRKSESYDITQNLYYGDYANFLLFDAPGHKSFSFMKKNVLQISDVVLYFLSPFEANKQSVKETIDYLVSLNTIFFVILTKVDVYKKDIDKLIERLSFLGILPKELGGDLEMYAVNYGNTLTLDNIRYLSSNEIMHDIHDTLSLFDMYSVKENMLYCVDTVRNKRFGSLNILINLMQREIYTRQIICNASIERIIDINTNTTVQRSNSIVIYAATNNISLGDVVHDTKIFSILKAIPLKRQSDAIVTVAIFAAHETRSKVLREYIESKNWFMEIAFESVGQPNNLVLVDIAAKKGLLLFFGKLSVSEIKHIKDLRVSLIHSDDFYFIQQELEKQYNEAKNVYDLELLRNTCIASARIKKIFNIKKDVIAGCDVLQGIIKKEYLAYVVRGQDILISCIKIDSMKIKSDDVQLACKGEEVGLVLNTNIVFKENDRILFIEKIS